LPRQTDNSDRHDTLPLPELNPLLNPVLGQNMGRWAEVYFTSPPEKREQAVQELLRELAAGPSAQAGRAVAGHTTTQEKVSVETTSESAQTLAVEPNLISCRSCGEKSPAEQRFCGMCGATLREEPSEVRSRIPAWSQPQSATPDPPAESEPPLPGAADPKGIFTPPAASASQAGHRASWLFESDVLKTVTESWPSPQRYRVYFGAALAVMIVAFVYVAWRSNSHSAPRVLPANPARPAAQASSHVSPKAADATPAASGARQTAPAPDRAVPQPAASVRISAPAVQAQGPQREAKAENIPVEEGSAGPVPSGNGAQELATAQSYLEGTQGQARNSGEAAKWLWKSVGKQNGAAILLLSDLYVKGDGVPKSCDQARLLLDAAARKGIAGAGERLRNLPAFGCE